MQPSKPFGTISDWILCALLTLVALLAPFAPFAALVFVVCCRPVWWAAFWHNPILNGVLLAFVLAGARVAFLQILYLLARFFLVATYPMSCAWIPEMLARSYLADLGWKVTPTPTESRFRCLAIAFVINLASWLGLLLPITAASWLRRRRAKNL